MRNLYQPILFKKNRNSRWEKGWKMISDNSETFLEEDMKVIVAQVFKYRVDWGII